MPSNPPPDILAAAFEYHLPGAGDPHSVVLVSGGRDFQHREFLFAVLDAVQVAGPIGLLIHGAATRGADTMADAWSQMVQVPCKRYPAQWREQGRGAGPIRNSLMLSEGKPTALVAFTGGPGTADMVRKAKRVGLVKFRSYLPDPLSASGIR